MPSSNLQCRWASLGRSDSPDTGGKTVNRYRDAGGGAIKIFFIDAAVTERFSPPGSLRTYLEEEAIHGLAALLENVGYRLVRALWVIVCLVVSVHKAEPCALQRPRCSSSKPGRSGNCAAPRSR
eukprot:3997399-Pleurochrysis_carterae.AAC.1